MKNINKMSQIKDKSIKMIKIYKKVMMFIVHQRALVKKIIKNFIIIGFKIHRKKKARTKINIKIK